MTRWLEVWSTFSMTAEHRPGRLHGNADGLSRKPGDDTEINSMADNSNNIAEQPNPSCMQVGRTSTENQSDEAIKLLSLQQENDELSVVLSLVESNEKPNFTAVSSDGYVLKSLWSQFPCLELRDGLLVRRREDTDNDTVTYQALVQRKMRRTRLKCCHDLKTSGHLGVSKTISKAKQKFYWPDLQADVRSYVAGCEACSKRKGSIPTKQAPMQIVRSGYPIVSLAIDIFGELPLTEMGNKYIVVRSDYFTKWTEALPMPNMEACTVAKIHVERFYADLAYRRQYTLTKVVIESNLFQEMCKLLGIGKNTHDALSPAKRRHG